MSQPLSADAGASGAAAAMQLSQPPASTDAKPLSQRPPSAGAAAAVDAAQYPHPSTARTAPSTNGGSAAAATMAGAPALDVGFASAGSVGSVGPGAVASAEAAPSHSDSDPRSAASNAPARAAAAVAANAPPAKASASAAATVASAPARPTAAAAAAAAGRPGRRPVVLPSRAALAASSASSAASAASSSSSSSSAAAAGAAASLSAAGAGSGASAVSSSSSAIPPPPAVPGTVGPGGVVPLMKPISERTVHGDHAYPWFPKDELRVSSPSRHDGVSEADEHQLRKDTCAFIAEVGQRLEIGVMAIATASFYFHVFFARLSFKQYDRYEVAAACLFLANKIEEKRKRVSDIMKMWYATRRIEAPPKDGPEYDRQRQRIFVLEVLLLDTCEYKFNVVHPYFYIMRFLKKLFLEYAQMPAKFEEETIKGPKGLAQAAWIFLNDSIRSWLCLIYPPDAIAVASIYLTLRNRGGGLEHVTRPNADPAHARPWHEELFCLNKKVLGDMCAQILKCIDVKPAPGAGPVTAASHAGSGIPGDRAFSTPASSTAVTPDPPTLHPASSAPLARVAGRGVKPVPGQPSGKPQVPGGKPRSGKPAAAAAAAAGAQDSTASPEDGELKDDDAYAASNAPSVGDVAALYAASSSAPAKPSRTASVANGKGHGNGHAHGHGSAAATAEANKKRRRDDAQVPQGAESLPRAKSMKTAHGREAPPHLHAQQSHAPSQSQRSQSNAHNPPLPRGMSVASTASSAAAATAAGGASADEEKRRAKLEKLRLLEEQMRGPAPVKQAQPPPPAAARAAAAAGYSHPSSATPEPLYDSGTGRSSAAASGGAVTDHLLSPFIDLDNHSSASPALAINYHASPKPHSHAAGAAAGSSGAPAHR